MLCGLTRAQGKEFKTDNQMPGDEVTIRPRYGYLNWLRIIEVCTKKHEKLWHKVWHIIRKCKNTGAESNDSCMTLDDQLWINNICSVSLLDLCWAELFEMSLIINKNTCYSLQTPNTFIQKKRLSEIKKIHKSTKSNHNKKFENLNWLAASSATDLSNG